MREVVAEAESPVMLYSIGKDSVGHAPPGDARRSIPAKPPFPLLHVDTTWKFREMYAFRDRMAPRARARPARARQPRGPAPGHQPVHHGSEVHTDVMKTEALKQALDQHGFDVAFGGARRDEEKLARQGAGVLVPHGRHRWDPKNQRPELWRLYNARKRQGRVDPRVPAVELDRARRLAVHLPRADPDRAALPRRAAAGGRARRDADHGRRRADAAAPGERPTMRRVRFRTLGCYPLTGAIESDADTLAGDRRPRLCWPRTSERQGRLIDHDQPLDGGEEAGGLFLSGAGRSRPLTSPSC